MEHNTSMLLNFSSQMPFEPDLRVESLEKAFLADGRTSISWKTNKLANSKLELRNLDTNEVFLFEDENWVTNHHFYLPSDFRVYRCVTEVPVNYLFSPGGIDDQFLGLYLCTIG